MKRFGNILIWVLILSYLIVALSFVSEKRKNIPCHNIDVLITDKTNNYFVEKDDVIALIYDKGEDIIGYSIDSINIANLETIILNHPSIKNAEIYRNIYGNLHVKVEQRNPIIRIVNYNKESYYIDDEGALMPLSHKYTAHVLVASGVINEPYTLRYTKDILGYNQDDELNRGQLLRDLYILGKYLHQDPFWEAQIEQIYVINNEFELIPRVGTQIIEFGSIENYKEKLRNLKALYRVGFKKFGWNTYTKINLKYNNQVICTKK